MSGATSIASVASLAMQGAGTVSKMSGQNAQSGMQAASFENQAAVAQENNDLNVDNLSRQQALAEGQVSAAYGAAGVDAGSGSALAARSDTASNYARKIFADNFSTANQVNALNQSAANAILQGENANNASLFSLGSRVAGSGFLQNLFSGSGSNPSAELNAANTDGLLAAQGSGIDAGGFT